MTPEPHPTVVGLAEIAERLGVERNTVDQWRQRGLLPEPPWTVGGRPAWDMSTILDWADARARRTMPYVADDGFEWRFPILGPAGAEVIRVPRPLALTEKRLKDWMDTNWSVRADGEQMNVPLYEWVKHMGHGIGRGLHLPSAADDIRAATAESMGRITRRR